VCPPTPMMIIRLGFFAALVAAASAALYEYEDGGSAFNWLHSILTGMPRGSRHRCVCGYGDRNESKCAKCSSFRKQMREMSRSRQTREMSQPCRSILPTHAWASNGSCRCMESTQASEPQKRGSEDRSTPGWLGPHITCSQCLNHHAPRASPPASRRVPRS
jgi:hypothetical protein